MSLRIGVVLNRAAGSPKDRRMRAQIAEMLGGEGRSLEIHSARRGAELKDGAVKLMERGCDILVAAGGDGTVSTLASILIGTGIPLGVLPLGTLNHFARDLRIPPGLKEACDTILAGNSTLVDAGEVNGRYFINNSSLGLYPSIVRRREHWERTGWSRLLAFAAAIVYALRRYPFLTVEMSVDGKGIARRTPFVFIGNNQYELEGLRLGRRSRLDGGCLALYTAHRTGRWGLVRIAVSALFRRLQRYRDFEIQSVHELSIGTRRRRVAVALDGEVAHMTPPLLYSIHPGALRVMVPA
jgi:diacylglycerol kinase family enzyme